MEAFTNNTQNAKIGYIIIILIIIPLLIFLFKYKLDLDECEKKLAGTINTLKETQNSVYDKDKRLNEYEKKITGAAILISDKNNQIQELESTSKRQQDLLQKYKSDIDEYEKKITGIAILINDKNKQIQKYELELDDQQKKNQKYKIQLGNLADERDKLQFKIKNLDAELFSASFYGTYTSKSKQYTINFAIKDNRIEMKRGKNLERHGIFIPESFSADKAEVFIIDPLNPSESSLYNKLIFERLDKDRFKITFNNYLIADDFTFKKL